ncbi:MAG: L-serine ammonia-lyase, iron-sulfur-dependent, subunit alpha [Candidatus Aminicenantes bacterium]|nr:L-serine ammonia-lyase, iron-sulfur-dependent, subunit alpha [Candidatus Aminicenantes bacterium]
MKSLKETIKLSILNHVLGPVIRGPSSSHTAGSYYLGRLARSIVGDTPLKVKIIFDKKGSYARVFRQQKSDLGFAAGLLGWEITDERFAQALHLAAESGLDLSFEIQSIPEADHPNFVKIEIENKFRQKISLKGKSVGGGMVEIIEINGWPVKLRGDSYEYLFELPKKKNKIVVNFLNSLPLKCSEIKVSENTDISLWHLTCTKKISSKTLEKIKSYFNLKDFKIIPPLMPVVSGEPLFRSAAEAIELAVKQKKSLGKLAITYESELLNLKENEIRQQLAQRLEIMKQSVASGLKDNLTLQLLKPKARFIYQAEKEGKLIGGLLTRASARAMAAQHTAASMGVVCAAPTAGSAGTLPGIIVTLLEDKGIAREKMIEALAAAGAVGLVVGYRATFAAEVAGCQVEIGAAGAMGAAAVIEAVGGGAKEAFDAAAISFQNSMGSVCDLVQGFCEIPCHTRNAIAAASAFVCADLINGGYDNPIPFDETIDAVYEVGKMLPPELKVTSLGGLALCPSAQSLRRPQ